MGPVDEADASPWRGVKIDILYRRPLRRWQARLADALRQAGHDVQFVEGARHSKLPLAIRTILAMERRILRPTNSQFDPVAPPSVFVGARASADLTLALDGEDGGAGLTLEPLFDGERGDAAFLAMVTRDGAPLLRIRKLEAEGPVDVVTACLAIEERESFSRALDQLASRIVTLLVQAVALAPLKETVAGPSMVSSERRGIGPARYFARAIARKTLRRIRGTGADDWRIGYRRGGEDGAFTLLAHDERARFLADPMPFAHEGRSHIFFEDFPYATRRGVIGMVTIDGDGRASAARTVLEETFHLSYPFVFEHDGTIYMLPETSAAGRIQLYRADPFPTRWVPDRVLVDGIVAADATLVRHDGLWWMFATLSDDGGSTWDALGLFHAPDLHGPWTAHPRNPVLVDAGAARPAGAMWHENGCLMRVAQDCRDGYGRALAICRVDRIDETGFAQTIVRCAIPPADAGGDGLHTWNRAGGLEVIDLHFSTGRIARDGRGRGALHVEVRD